MSVTCTWHVRSHRKWWWGNTPIFKRQSSEDLLAGSTGLSLRLSDSEEIWEFKVNGSCPKRYSWSHTVAPPHPPELFLAALVLGTIIRQRCLICIENELFLETQHCLHQIKCLGQWRKSESTTLWFMIYDLWKLYGKAWSPRQALEHQDP